jgi:hypothetical protein
MCRLLGIEQIDHNRPIPTPFVDEIINEVMRHECYSFTDGFSGYNQVPIAKEDQEKTTLFLNLTPLHTK